MKPTTFKCFLILLGTLFFFNCESSQSLFSGKAGDSKKNSRNSGKSSQNESKDKDSTSHMQGNNLEIEQEDNSGSMGSASDSVDITGAFLINCEKSNELDESGKVPLNCRVEKEGQRYDSSESVNWQIVEAKGKTKVTTEKGEISSIENPDWHAQAKISLEWFYEVQVEAKFEGNSIYWPEETKNQGYPAYLTDPTVGNGMLSAYEIVYANNMPIVTGGGMSNPFQLSGCSSENKASAVEKKYDGSFEVVEDNTNLEIKINSICGIGFLTNAFSIPGEVALYSGNNQVVSQEISESTSSLFFPLTAKKGIYTLQTLCHSGTILFVPVDCDDFSMKDIHIKSTNDKPLRWKGSTFPKY